MKKIVFVFVFLFAISFQTYAKWFWQTPLPNGSYLSAVCFINENSGWAVGNAGTILRTTNGGNTWSSQSSGTINRLYSVSFTDSNNGTAVGGNGTIVRTTDAGNTWTIQSSGTSRDLYAVSFTDSNSGTAVGGNGTILRTNNGGGVYLPVELISFDVIYSNSSIKLKWLTATELNNHGFEIERSLDKTNWATIGFREGKGTTSEPQDYTYSDDISEISSSKLYYRLKQVDFNGTFEYTKIVEVEIAPTKFALQQNYPNPFNPSTKISWQSPVGSWQTLKIYDILGKEIATLVNEEKPAGNYEVDFNASQLASGIYYYQLRAGDYVETKKMILLK